jgi:hypothetical protein
MAQARDRKRIKMRDGEVMSSSRSLDTRLS